MARAMLGGTRLVWYVDLLRRGSFQRMVEIRDGRTGIPARRGGIVQQSE